MQSCRKARLELAVALEGNRGRSTRGHDGADRSRDARRGARRACRSVRRSRSSSRSAVSIVRRSSALGRRTTARSRSVRATVVHGTASSTVTSSATEPGAAMDPEAGRLRPARLRSGDVDRPQRRSAEPPMRGRRACERTAPGPQASTAGQAVAARRRSAAWPTAYTPECRRTRRRVARPSPAPSTRRRPGSRELRQRHDPVLASGELRGRLPAASWWKTLRYVAKCGQSAGMGRRLPGSDARRCCATCGEIRARVWRNAR